MRTMVRAAMAGALGLAVVAGLGVERAPAATPQRENVAAVPDGALLYQLHCASCHGVGGRGDGPDAALFAAPPRNLRDGFLGRYNTEDLARRVRLGASLELALDLPALRARAGDVEAIAAHLERLPSIDWRLAERGQEIYVERCEFCHGPFGRPTASVPEGVRPPRDLADPAFQASVDRQALVTAVRHGRRGMPAITPRVGEEDARVLVAYVRLLSPGYELYSRYCEACHGADGRGTGSFGETRPRPTVIFDRAYFVRRDPEQLRSAVWHMLSEQKPAMPHFRTALTDAQVRAIIDWLKRTE